MGSCCTKKDATAPEIQSVDAIEPSFPVHNGRIEVLSRFTVNEVKVSKLTPKCTQDGIFKYECPICMYFFTAILVSKCCRNYVCHYCIEEIKSNRIDAACPHCRSRPLLLADPQPEDSVRVYSERMLNSDAKKTYEVANRTKPSSEIPNLKTENVCIQTEGEERNNML
jgi:DNA-directed RNA polymerase subunit RPC12/RpoP